MIVYKHQRVTCTATARARAILPTYNQFSTTSTTATTTTTNYVPARNGSSKVTHLNPTDAGGRVRSLSHLTLTASASINAPSIGNGAKGEAQEAQLGRGRISPAGPPLQRRTTFIHQQFQQNWSVKQKETCWVAENCRPVE